MARGRRKENQSAYCPACGAEIYFRKRPRVNQHVTCRQCSSLLEVLELAPLELDWAFADPLDELYGEHYKEESFADEWDYYDFTEDETVNKSISDTS